jgi:hypothetical protein
MTKPQQQTLFLLSFTTILVGYFMVWLPGPSAGLQLLGFEMGEWTKFFGLGVKRNWFYLPPITLALAMLFFTVGWGNGRFQTWLFRGVAVVVSLLAFPALEDLTGPSQSEYLSRVAAIALVVVVAGLLALLGSEKRPLRQAQRKMWLTPVSRVLMVGVGLVGLILPTLIYGEVRPFVSDLLRLELGYGPGFWLNGVGHTAVVLLAAWQLAKK